MVKLTPELIEQSLQYINPMRDRELSLRGYKIPVIENLGATLDQFDTIDLTDNDIRKLDGFPLLKRLKNLIVNNNRIVRIAEGLEENVPLLESLYLTNNLLQELTDLDPLSGLKCLQHLSLLGNPVTTREHYRLYTIFKLPQVRVLDFRRVRQWEREAATRLLRGRRGREVQKEIRGSISSSNTFTPGGTSILSQRQSSIHKKMSAENSAALRAAISNARSMEEVERLSHLLRTGTAPLSLTSKLSSTDVEEMEEDGKQL